MAIYGDNDVYANSPVAAYSVGTRNGGIISGGTGGETAVTEGVRFLWTYDPNSPDETPSGFTGQGWFENTTDSPIGWYCFQKGIDLETILAGFKNGDRTNLNDVFTAWQSYVNEQASGGNDVVKTFQGKLPLACWSNI